MTLTPIRCRIALFSDDLEFRGSFIIFRNVPPDRFDIVLKIGVVVRVITEEKDLSRLVSDTDLRQMIVTEDSHLLHERYSQIRPTIDQDLGLPRFFVKYSIIVT